MNRFIFIIYNFILVAVLVSCADKNTGKKIGPSISSVLCADFEEAMATVEDHICHLYEMVDDPCVLGDRGASIDYFRIFEWSEVSASNIYTYINDGGCFYYFRKSVNSSKFNYFHFVNIAGSLEYRVLKKLITKEVYREKRHSLERVIDELSSNRLDYNNKLFVLESYHKGQLNRAYVSDALSKEHLKILEIF